MTTQEIIKQTEKLTTEQQKNLASYFVLRFINPSKQNLMQLFHYENDFNTLGNSTVFKNKKQNILDIFDDWKNKLPANLVINEDEFYNI